MFFETLFIKKYSESWYRLLSAEEFYADRKRTFPDGETSNLSPLSDPEFRALPVEVKKEIWASKFGMDSETFWSLPISRRNALIDDSQGRDFQSGLDTGISAAQSDAKFTALTSFLKGASATGTIIAFVGLGLTVYINRDKLKGIGK